MTATVCAVACSSTSDTAENEPVTASRSSEVVVATAAGCQVSWTKIDYDNPGTDDSEFIELRIRRTSLSANTFGDCGLKRIDLINGNATQSCAVYASFDLENVAIPGDDFFVLCNDDGPLGAVCDIDAGGLGWLQNAGGSETDEVSFVSTSDKETVHGWYGGANAPACVPATDPGTVVRAEREFNSENPNQVNLDCGSGFTKTDESLAKPGTESCSTGTGGSGGSGGSAGSSSGGSGGSVTGGTGGSSSGGSAGSSAGGTAGSSAGGTGGSSSGGAAGSSSGGASGSSSGGSSSGGAAGSSSGGAAGSASGGAAGSGAGGSAAGGAAGSSSGGAAGSTTGGAAGSTTGGSAGSGVAGTTFTGGSGGSSSGNAGAGGTSTTDPGDDSGCGCRTVSTPASGHGWWALSLAFVFGLRRRR